MSANTPPLSASLAVAGTTPVGAGFTGRRSTDTPPRPQEPTATAPLPPVEPPPQQALLAADLRIEVDKAAGRFVLTFSDPETGETLRRFPHEAQLAFARALAIDSRNTLDVET